MPRVAAHGNEQDIDLTPAEVSFSAVQTQAQLACCLFPLSYLLQNVTVQRPRNYRLTSAARGREIQCWLLPGQKLAQVLRHPPELPLTQSCVLRQVRLYLRVLYPTIFQVQKRGSPTFGVSATKNPFCPVKPYFAAKNYDDFATGPICGPLVPSKICGPVHPGPD